MANLAAHSPLINSLRVGMEELEKVAWRMFQELPIQCETAFPRRRGARLGIAVYSPSGKSLTSMKSVAQHCAQARGTS